MGLVDFLMSSLGIPLKPILLTMGFLDKEIIPMDNPDHINELFNKYKSNVNAYSLQR